MHEERDTHSNPWPTSCHRLRFTMHNVEKRGWPLVMHVHDEVVSEVAEHLAASVKTSYEDTMGILPSWLEGLPLAAKAWVDKRYIK